MKTLLALTCSLLLLAACAPYPEPDLYASSANGQATAVAAQARLHATEVARQDRNAQATMSAAATQGAVTSEIQLLNARLAATREASELEYARRQATLALVGTQQAYQLTAESRPVIATLQAVALAATVSSAQATQTALARRVEYEQYRQALAPFVAAGALLFLLLASITLLSRLLDWWITWQDRRRSLYQTSLGPIVFVNGTPYLVESLDRLQRFQRKIAFDAQPIEPVEYLPSAISISAPARSSETTSGLVSRIVADSIDVAGPESDRIPRWSQLPNCSSERWQRAIAALRHAGIVETRTDGTYLVGFQSLVELHQALLTGQLHVRPAPLEL